MTITWHGHYTLKIQTPAITLLIDPHGPETGLQPLRVKADIVALSNPASPAMSHHSGIQGDPQVINTPGEYATKGLTLHAPSWYEENGTEHSLQRWHIENYTLLNLGALNRLPTTTELQELEKTDIDILLLPIGGGDGLTTSQALEVLTTIEPKIVIPTHFKIPKIKEKLEEVEQFAEEVGVNTKETQNKFSIKSRKQLPEGLETIILMP